MIVIEGHSIPQCNIQQPEILWLIHQQLIAHDCKSLLVIGSGYAALEWHVARKYYQKKLPLELTSIDIDQSQARLLTLCDISTRYNYNTRCIYGDSTDPTIYPEQMWDAIFIDASHTHKEILQEYFIAKKRATKLIALHNINTTDNHAAPHIWKSLRDKSRTSEIRTTTSGGIGIVWQ